MHYVVWGLLIFVSGLIFVVINLATEKTELKHKLLDTQATLQLQNEKIQQMELDSKKYHCDIDSLNQYTKDKYKNIKDSSELKTCDEKIAEFEKMLGIYNGENDKKSNNK